MSKPSLAKSTFQVLHQSSTKLIIQRGFLTYKDALQHELRQFWVLPSVGVIALSFLPLIGKMGMAFQSTSGDPSVLFMVITFAIVTGVSLVVFPALFTSFFVTLDFDYAADQLICKTRNFLWAKRSRYKLSQFVGVLVREKSEESDCTFTLELVRQKKRALVVDKVVFPIDYEQEMYASYSMLIEPICRFMRWEIPT
jgi:hypothetical protein